MRQIARLAPALLVVLLAACDTPITSSEVLETEDGTPLVGPAGANFTLGGATLLTASASDVWPELEGDFVAWYREAPADQQGLWVMDLRTNDAFRVWEGEILSAFDLQDGEIFWGSADGLHAYDIATGSLETLASTFRQYRDVSVGPRYIVGTASEGSDRPFVFDRVTNQEEMILTPTSVPATRGWGDWVLYSDHRTSLRVRQLYLYHIPTGAETRITEQDQLLTTANADISDDRVVYFARRFCPGPLALYDMTAETTGEVDLPGICPIVVLLEGDVLVYRHNASGGIIYLGFMDLASGEKVELELANPGNWRIDADLDGTRVVHTSTDGLTLLDLRFQEALPPVADAGGPYEVLEGAPVTLDGSGSFSLNDEALRYLWSVSEETTLEGVSPAWSWPDDGVFPVALTVSEESGLSDLDQTEVTVLNQAPTAAFGNPSARTTRNPGGLRGMEGEPLTVVASFSDPGLLDAPWSWRLSWDDGELGSGAAEEQGALPPVTWTPERAGSFTLVLRVEDKDGGVAETEILLEVEDAPLPPVRVHAGSGEQHTVPALHSNGVFPVVVFGMAEATAEVIDAESIRLGPGEASPLTDEGHAPVTEDRDGDGFLDLVLQFRVPEVGLRQDDAEVCLVGATLEREELQGCSPIRIAGTQGKGKQGD